MTTGKKKKPRKYITYDELNTLTHTCADAIDKLTGREVDRTDLNAALTAFLEQYGLMFKETVERG